jgi:hypothetical protein
MCAGTSVIGEQSPLPIRLTFCDICLSPFSLTILDARGANYYTFASLLSRILDLV